MTPPAGQAVTWYTYLIRPEGKRPRLYRTRAALMVGRTYGARLVCEYQRFEVLALWGQQKI